MKYIKFDYWVQKSALKTDSKYITPDRRLRGADTKGVNEYFTYYHPRLYYIVTFLN